MRVEVSLESMDEIADYARIPISFEVTEVFDVVKSEHADAQLKLSLRRLGVSYLKDYDTISEEDPTKWARRFDVSKWGFFAARIDGHEWAVRSLPTIRPWWTCLKVNPTWRCCGTFGWRLQRAVEEWAQRSSPQRKHGRPLDSAGSSRLKPRTST